MIYQQELTRNFTNMNIHNNFDRVEMKFYVI